MPARLINSTVAKISPPVISGIFQRQNLFNKFNSLRKNKRSIIWISALAGSGKTTLVKSYLDANHLPSLWYQLDEGDADIASFFYYMSNAAKKAAPRKRDPIPILTPEYMPDLHGFTRLFFRKLFGRLKASSVIVFDNYQEVPEKSELHDVIRTAISILPTDMILIIISRRDPPPQLAYLQADIRAALIGSIDLRLRNEESTGITRARGWSRLSKQHIKRIHEKVHGWTAGLILALESAKSEGFTTTVEGELPSENVFNYFAGEILRNVDKKKRDFLIKTSFLPRMTAKMAQKISGNSRAGNILSELKQNNYFIDRRSHPEFVYQYHPLFRDFLLNQTKDTFTKPRLVQLKRSAAKILIESGHLEDAAAIFLDISDWKNLINLINTEASRLIVQGRHATLKKWLTGIPKKSFEKDPWLLYWLGMCVMPFNPAQSQVHFENSFNLFRSKHDSAGIYLSLAGASDAIFYECHDFSKYDRWIDFLDDIQKEYPDFPSEEIKELATPGIFLALMLRRPDHPHFNFWLEQTTSVFEKSSNPDIRVLAGNNLGTYFYWSGNFANCSIMIDSLRGLIKPGRVRPQVGLNS